MSKQQLHDFSATLNADYQSRNVPNTKSQILTFRQTMRDLATKLSQQQATERGPSESQSKSEMGNGPQLPKK